MYAMGGLLASVASVCVCVCVCVEGVVCVGVEGVVCVGYPLVEPQCLNTVKWEMATPDSRTELHEERTMYMLRLRQ